MPDVLTTAEVAEMFSVSPKTITRWVEQGVLPAPIEGLPSWRFRRSDIDAILEPKGAA